MTFGMQISAKQTTTGKKRLALKQAKQRTTTNKSYKNKI